MEKWKLGVIGALLLGLAGYGVFQQQQPAREDAIAQTLASTNTDGTARPTPPANKAAGFVGQDLGGEELPEWSQLGPWDNTKQAVTLGSLKGQPAMVEFFRINCPHCQDAAPFMEALYQRYQPRGLRMAAVQSPGDYKDKTNQETMWPSVKNWVKVAGITYPVAMDKDSQYFQHTINGTNYPTTMISDANGKVVYAQTGHDTGKAISLAVELEKLYPGAGTPKARAQSLAKFMRPFIFGDKPADSNLDQSLTDDMEQRLMGKVDNA